MAEHKILLGMDIGGTDIKLAAAADGQLLACHAYDWDPSTFKDADSFIAPILQLVENTRLTFDGIGISFPDVVAENKIVGGETPKTMGIRTYHGQDYEEEFAKISSIGTLLQPFLNENGTVKCANDGAIAAFTSAVEMTVGGACLPNGLIGHSLGTDFGTGWVFQDGRIPPWPLELYNCIIDLGSVPEGNYPPEDVRSTCNLNTGLPGALQRYASQSGIFRMAVNSGLPGLKEELWSMGFLLQKENILEVPGDRRKDLLSRLAKKLTGGSPDERQLMKNIFGNVGEVLAVVCQEMKWLTALTTHNRVLYGRLVQEPACFEAICRGALSRNSNGSLSCADSSLAITPLMQQLSAKPDCTVAQFGQAIGALYYSLL